MLALEEKMMFLREVPLFQHLTAEHLHTIAQRCEETCFAADTYLVQQGESGGKLYIVLSGRVGIEHERREGQFARLETHESQAYVGEVNLFDSSPHSFSALALEETFVMVLTRETMSELIAQHSDLALAFITVLSRLLRETRERLAEHTRARPRKLQQFFDQI